MATQIQPSEISDIIKSRIEKLDIKPEVRTEGTIVNIKDGIVRIYGLRDVMYGEMIEFPENTYGLAFNLERDSVGAVVLGAYEHLEEGMTARCTGRILEVPIGEALLGRVVDALGNPIDGKGPVETELTSPIEKVAPGVITRKSVDTPLQTGLKSIDAMVPVGRGQRELIIGDRQTGKTAVAIDTIINQKGGDIFCIYVAVGKRRGEIARIVATLEEYGALDYTIIVTATASESAALQYIAPYGGCAMGEWFMENGMDALVIYDDLTKHANAYRQVSLLLRSPPGREAFPGDVFYLHSRLLERAAQLSEERGGGSLTALPVIETQLGDVSAFVPTNVISITDGQIYLEGELFNSGQRPALNTGISVSRVGSSAQTKAMKKVAGGLKLQMAQFRDLAAFAQFGSNLDKDTQAQLDRGLRLNEIFKQPQYQPLGIEDQIAVIMAGTDGLIDDVPVERVSEWEEDFLRAFHTQYSAVADAVRNESKSGISDDTKAQLQDAIKSFTETWS